MTDSSDAIPLNYSKPEEPTLARTMGPVALVIYGVGDMLGAGIYGLVGKAAGLMGNAVWLAFASSMVAALLTGLSYACLGSRYPRAAGAAFITHHAYRLPFLSYLVGLAVAASGLTSMATGSRVIAEHLQKFEFLQRLGVASVPVPVLAGLFLLFVTLVVFRGIRESTWMNVLCTFVEVAGLTIVIAVGLRYWGSVNYLEFPPERAGDDGWALMALTLNGAVLTFFSFIGFEDILNVAEEVKDPRRTIPIGLVGALVVGTLIYMAVSITAVSVLPYRTLAASKSPLVDVVTTAAPGFPAWLFNGIAVFAVANTALLNYVMGSRLLYGMSRQKLLPAPLGKVHPKRRTPHVAIAVLFVVVLTLAIIGGIRPLAEATALLLLGAFVIVNTALVVLKFRPDEPRGSFEVPWIVPALGALVCLCLIGFRLYRAVNPTDPVDRHAPLIAIGIGLFIATLYLIQRPRNVTEEALAHVEHPHE